MSIYAAVFISAVIFLYGVIYFSAVKIYPPEWSADLLMLTRAEIERKLGVSPHDFSAKGFVAWERKKWWGWQSLEILADNIQYATAKPKEIRISLNVGVKNKKGEYFTFTRTIITFSESGHEENFYFTPMQIGSYFLSFIQ